MRNSDLSHEVDELRRQLEETQQALQAIRTGEVDAVVVSGVDGEHVYVLKGAEQPYRIFVETMNEGAATLLGDGTVVYANHRLSQMLGWPLEQVIGASLLSFIAPDSRERVQRLLKQAATTPGVGLVPLLAKGGSALWAELSMSPVELEQGVGICLIASDITERKKAEETRAYLASIVDSSEDAILGKDLDGTILSWNHGAERLYGYAAEEIIGEPVTRLCPPGREGETLDLLRRVGHGEVVIHFETQRIRKDGRGIEVSLTLSPIRDQDGRVDGVSTIARDITARKHAEEVIQRHAEQYATVLATSSDGFWRFDRDGWILEVNDAYCGMSGYTREELLRLRVSDLEAIETSEDVTERIRKIGQTGFDRFESRHRRKDGSLFAVEISASLWRSAGEFLLFARDISFRKRAEEELRRASAYNRSLIEASLDPLVTIAPDGTITDVNAATERATGRSRVQLVGTDFCDYFTDPDKAREGYRTAFCEGRVQDYELEIVRASGATLPVIYNASVYRNEAGVVQGVFAAARDISRRKRAEEKLKLERQRFFDVLETLPAMICLLTPDYHVAFANRSFREMFGDSGGRHCYEYCYGRSAPCEFCETYQVLRTGQPHRWEVRNGSKVIDAYDFPFTDVDGKPLILEMDFDITERRRTEEVLAQQRTELARSNAELQQFAYVASHDLQEPLRAVASFTKLLAERYQDKLDSDANDFIGFAVNGARRAQQLINDLLTFSRVGTRGKPFVPTDCEAVLKDALADLTATIEDARGEITHGTLPVIQADETQLGQLLRNLVGNALKFHGVEPPRVHVSAEQIGGMWRFSVRDNGIGIAAQHREEIFAVFHRLHTSAEYPGTGIGLAIAKKIVERHGGRIWVESDPGKGSTFYFTIACRTEVADVQ